MSEVSIFLNRIVFSGSRHAPEERTAVVTFEIRSADVGSIELSVDVVPVADDPDGIYGVVIIARRTLVEYGKALAVAGEKYKPPMIYSPKSE
jgi:hypothetical protein